jgi:hypothetical protein
MVRRGDVAAARDFLSRLPDSTESENVQNRSAEHAVHAAIARAEGRPEEALRLARIAFGSWEGLGLISRTPLEGFVEALEAAFELGDDAKIDELIDFAYNRPSGEVLDYFDGQRLRFTGRRCARRGDDDGAVAAFEAALARFREVGNVYWLAVTSLEAGEHHLAFDRPGAARPLLDAARAGLQQVGARPMLARLERVEGVATSASA